MVKFIEQHKDGNFSYHYYQAYIYSVRLNSIKAAPLR